MFSFERARIGRVDPDGERSIQELRRQYSRTHAFRFDSRNQKIANVSLQPEIEALGEVEEVAVGQHLLLFAGAIEQQLRHWFSGNRKILKPFRPLVCLGSRDRLLTKALRETSCIPSFAGIRSRRRSR